LVVPRMSVRVQGEMCLADTDAILDAAGGWDFQSFVAPRIAPGEFMAETEGRATRIDVQRSGLQLSYDENQPTLFAAADAHWTRDNLVFDLCRMLQQPDVKHVVLLDWIGQIVDDLMDAQGMTLRQLMPGRFALRTKLLGKVNAGRERFRTSLYERTFLSESAKIEMDFENGFRFSAEMYDDQFMFYRGSYHFHKHFLGPDRVPPFDGAPDGEETQCAWEINGLEEVDFWIRNIARHPRSFSLPAVTDRFYPDFVCQLKDGRILVVEYKGEHLRKAAAGDNRIGKAMERASDGRCLFLMVFKKENDMEMRAQLKRKLAE